MSCFFFWWPWRKRSGMLCFKSLKGGFFFEVLKFPFHLQRLFFYFTSLQRHPVADHKSRLFFIDTWTTTSLTHEQQLHWPVNNYFIHLSKTTSLTREQLLHWERTLLSPIKKNFIDTWTTTSLTREQLLHWRGVELTTNVINAPTLPNPPCYNTHHPPKNIMFVCK